MSLTALDLPTALAPYIAAVDDAMRAVVTTEEAALKPLYGMLQYHLGWVDHQLHPITARSGKRLRPVFLLLTCEALGGEWRQALPAAAAIELTHNFSLIHDDIEDGDVERHGRPTLWKLWGEAQAINAGDGLFVLARLALAGLLAEGVSVATLAAVSVAYDRACLAITEGQFLDMQFETQLNVTEAEYRRMVSGKTAALLSGATRIGALVAGADQATVERLATFGYEVGVAFQIIDDMLGIWGDPRQTGKLAANDIRRRKKSLPVAVGFERGTGQAAETLRRIYAQPSLTDEDVRQVIRLLDDVGARQYAQQLADDLHNKAQTRLAGLRGDAVTILTALTESMAKREF